MGSTISTLLHDKINPKDCQVLSVGDFSGFSNFLGLLQVMTRQTLGDSNYLRRLTFTRPSRCSGGHQASPSWVHPCHLLRPTISSRALTPYMMDIWHHRSYWKPQKKNMGKNENLGFDKLRWWGWVLWANACLWCIFGLIFGRSFCWAKKKLLENSRNCLDSYYFFASKR